MKRTAILLASLVVFAGCGDDDGGVVSGGAQNKRAPDTPRYTVSTTVLQSPEHGPQLCVGGMATSLPPQCGGPDVVGWNWGAVDNEESIAGTTWGEYTVVGTWDGARLTLSEPPGPPSKSADVEPMDFSTPCAAPSGGWAVVDADTATEDALQAALTYSRAQPDHAGTWVDQSLNPAAEEGMNDPTKLVLNMRFTGDVTRHQRALREIWGGALCVTEADQALTDLERIQRDLQEELDVVVSAIDEVRGAIEVTVVVAADDLQAALDQRYGTGVVLVTSALQPID